MPSLMRSLGLVFGVGMVVGIGGLLAMPAKMQEPQSLFARWREETPPTCAHQAWSKTGSKTWPQSRPETEPRCQVGTQVGTQVGNQVGTTVRRWPVEAAKAKSTPATAPVAKPPSPREFPAARDPVVASTVATPPDQASLAPTKSVADRTSKARKAALSRIPVTVHASDSSQRTIMINPTSRQDAYYYSARRNVGLGSTW